MSHMTLRNFPTLKFLRCHNRRRAEDQVLWRRDTLYATLLTRFGAREAFSSEILQLVFKAMGKAAGGKEMHYS